MSEIQNSKARAEITVRNIKTGKVSIHSGRYGLYFERVGYCRKLGYDVLQYTAI